MKPTKALRLSILGEGPIVLRSAELFSGCGGLAMGLSLAGVHHELMVEWDLNAVNTVMHNRKRGIKHVKSWPIQCGDVRDIDWHPYAGRLDLIAGGPPCQPFSIGGNHKGQDDPRDMWPEAIRAVRETLPRAFLFENVRGLARPAFSDYLQWIVAQLRNPARVRRTHESSLDHLTRLRSLLEPKTYRVVVAQVNAADFGAAQKRHRLIVAGVRQDCAVHLATPVPTHSRERLLWDQWVSGEYWARHSIDVPPLEAVARADRATVARLAQSGIRPETKAWVTVRDALADLGPPTGEGNHRLQPGARPYPGHTGCPLDQPAKALKAGDHGVPGGENMMVLENGAVRYFTIREAARLQGLPDNYQFPGSWSESMRQLGNAVPTQLAESMVRWITSELSANTESNAAAA